jgi:hypothetical protein
LFLVVVKFKTPFAPVDGAEMELVLSVTELPPVDPPPPGLAADVKNGNKTNDRTGIRIW